MRQAVIAALLAALALAGSLPIVSAPAAAQQRTGPVLRVADHAQSQTLPPVVPMPSRNPRVPIASTVGAAIGILSVDLATGGMLLSPLGLPSAATILALGGGAVVAAAAPAYTLTERLVALIVTISAGAGGGYLGAFLVRPQPDFVGLTE